VHVALCETFDSPTPTPTSRSGDLNYTLWGVSRTGNFVNPTDQLNVFLPATLVGCGANQVVAPPRDVQICNGQVHEALNDGEGQAALAMYPKQPFDISSGRTGTVVFDVGDDSEGSHAAWPEFWWTDQPVPAPHSDLPGTTAFARNSFGFSMEGQCDGPNSGEDGGPGPYVGVGEMMETRANAFSDIPFTIVGCVKKGSPTALNHFEMRINQNRVEVWGSDAGSTAVRMLAYADGINLPLTKGVVWMVDAHYAACKFNDQCDHTFVWDNLGFDGVSPYRDLSFDVPDANAPVGSGAVNLGYDLPAGATVPFQVNGVYWDQPPTGVLVTFNFSNSGGGPIVPSVRVNGGPWHTLAWPYSFDGCGMCPVGIPIPQNETQTGTNTLEFTTSSEAVISNINLIEVAGAPAPG
jgi:hypothetical protein